MYPSWGSREAIPFCLLSLLHFSATGGSVPRVEGTPLRYTFGCLIRLIFLFLNKFRQVLRCSCCPILLAWITRRLPHSLHAELSDEEKCVKWEEIFYEETCSDLTQILVKIQCHKECAHRSCIQHSLSAGTLWRTSVMVKKSLFVCCIFSPILKCICWSWHVLQAACAPFAHFSACCTCMSDNISRAGCLPRGQPHFLVCKSVKKSYYAS
jgi:hypothetical protein